MQHFLPVSYLVASIFFILGVRFMGRMESAKRGNYISALGMGVAIITTWYSCGRQNFGIILSAIALGVAVGTLSAAKIAMSQMPQMVALFNGLGGFASCLVGFCELNQANCQDFSASEHFIRIATAFSILIGGVTFSGSVVAFEKLNGKLGTIANLFRKKLLPVVSAAATFVIALKICLAPDSGGIFSAILLVLFSLWLGIIFVIRIGGGDMPVVIALLNSLSGLAAAAAGFTIFNYVLIIAGCLVGASGLILTFVMCRAMNRSLRHIFFGNFGTASGQQLASTTQGEMTEPRAISPEDAFCVLEAARNVIFVPGYGMAISQAQHAVKELADLLKNNGTSVRYAVHPVAGRMPGHMNVLLAEANIPYDELTPLEEINREMEQVDVAVVIGANDVVNPSAVEDKASPIYGMPIIEVNRAKNVFILKRGSGSGFSGLQNNLFSKPNASLIYGDAKATLLAMAHPFK